MNFEIIAYLQKSLFKTKTKEQRCDLFDDIAEEKIFQFEKGIEGKKSLFVSSRHNKSGLTRLYHRQTG